MPCRTTSMLALLLALACAHPATDKGPRASVPLGLNYPPLPPGLVEEGGWLVGPDTAITYSLSVVAMGRSRALWLSRFTHHDSLGKAHWRLRRGIALPSLPEGYVLATVDCSVDGTPDARVVAVGRWDNYRFVDIRHAWVARTREERIDTLSPSRVTCTYEGDRD